MQLLSGRGLRLTGARPRPCAHVLRPSARCSQTRLVWLASSMVDGATIEELSLPIEQNDADAEALVLREAELQRQSFVMQDTCSFLASDLKMLFEKGEITESRYSPNIMFEDPITKYDSRDGYVFNIRMLRTMFNITFDLHSIAVSGPDSVTATWTMEMLFWLLPWKPNLTFTGRTVYRVDPSTGLVLSHIDYWDALQRNSFLSLEGVQHVLRMFLQLQVTPGIESPKYTVLKRFKDYEIRAYEPYLVAETPMGSGAGPASGAGFSELARYLFGGNQQSLSMEMTTPVFTSVEPATNSSTAMQFVMERRYADVATLPAPSDPRIATKQQEARYAAAIRFAGWPLDFDVVTNERQLRDMLIRDGYRPVNGYQLARYNDPSTPPAVRRNEVLIRLDGFVWPEQLPGTITTK